MATTDNYRSDRSRDPAGNFEAITPSDSTDLTNMARGVYVGVGGDIVAVDGAGNTTTFKNAIAGTILPIRVIRINDTNTTATNLVGLSG